ncbi:MAG: heavy-metal-associated domain-containing protein [Thermodesulfobacteriota bacterium]
MAKGLRIAFMTIICLMVPAVTQGQVESLTVTVDGLACPFCAYGIEKKLKKVAGVKAVTVSMQKGTVSLTAKARQSINYSQIPAAVLDSGFTPRTMRVVVSGTVTPDEKQNLHLQWDSKSLMLNAVEGDIRERLLSLAGTGGAVKVHGIIREKGAATWTLATETVEEVRQ